MHWRYRLFSVTFRFPSRRNDSRSCTVCLFQGSVAIAGAVVRWLQDNLGLIGSSEELGTCPEVAIKDEENQKAAVAAPSV